MEISKISGLWSNIKQYDEILTTFHLQHFFKKGLFSVNISRSSNYRGFSWEFSKRFWGDQGISLELVKVRTIRIWIIVSWLYMSIWRFVSILCTFLLVSLFFIWDALHDFQPLVQFKKRELHPWRSVTLSKGTGFSLQLY